MAKLIPKWRVRAIIAYYNICNSIQAEIIPDDIVKEIGIAKSTLFLLEKRFKLKGRVVNRRKRDRFIIDKNNCWVWQLKTNDNGYAREGYTDNNGKQRLRYVHIYNYEQKYGKVPEGLVLDHLCRNRACTNPDHLEPVTIAENNRRGSLAILNKDVADNIREQYKHKEYGMEGLALLYGVNIRTIQRIITNELWN